MTFAHKANCKMKEKNSCRANHPPGESRIHNYMLCARREQEVRTTKVLELEPGGETIIKMMAGVEDENNIEFDINEYDEDENEYNITRSRNLYCNNPHFALSTICRFNNLFNNRLQPIPNLLPNLPNITHLILQIHSLTLYSSNGN